MDQISIGGYTVTALSDGLSRLPTMFFPGLEECVHEAELDIDGTVHIPTGCFLIDTTRGAILVDAGLGPLTLPYPDGIPRANGSPTPPLSEGGRLPDELRSLGVAPADVHTIVLTHLHADHIGWLAPGGSPYFENARVVFGAADWDALIAPADDAEPGVRGMKAMRDAGRLEPVDGTTHHVGSGITLEHAPGHTPGSYVVVISSASKRLYLLGDVVQHPLQLNNAAITFLTDADARLAGRSRNDLLDRIERESAVAGMDHFPTGMFQRVVGGQRRTWQAATQ